MVSIKRHSKQGTTQLQGSLSTRLHGRGWGVVLLLVGLFSLGSYAQSVPIPNPNWPLDSVVNSSVHFYTVQGDRNYTEASSFVWTVEGGRLFFDQQLTSMAGNGTTAVVPGESGNFTRLWVVWDSFDTPLDTGYVYVYEISADGCQRSDMDAGKFKGMRIKVSSPPKARFLDDQTIVCSTSDSGSVIMEIEGMPPYDLTYTVNGTPTTVHLNAGDLADWDNDGEADNLIFIYKNLSGITVDETYVYEIISVSSGGVQGKILDYPTHTFIAHVQPPAPDINDTLWTEVTAGYDYTYLLADRGISPLNWYWELRDASTNLVGVQDWGPTPDYHCFFSSNALPGKYTFEAQYIDTYGCKSPSDKLNIELFGIPTIEFADGDTIKSCSASSLADNDFISVKVKYNGARTYGYTYIIYDPEGNIADPGGGVLNDLNEFESTIVIENRFINDFTPEEIRPWKVVITEAHTLDERVNVNIVNGKQEKIILIYPKPFIHDDIDFAN